MSDPAQIESARKLLGEDDFAGAEKIARQLVLMDRDDLGAWTVCMEATYNTKVFRECASNVVRLTSDSCLASDLRDLLDNYVFFIMKKVDPKVPGSLDGLSNLWKCGVWVGRGLHMTAVLGKVLYWSADQDFRIVYHAEIQNGVPVCADKFSQKSVDDEVLPMPVYRSINERIGTVRLYLDPYIRQNIALLEMEGCLRMKDSDIGADGSIRVYKGHHLIEFDRRNSDAALRGRISSDRIEDDQDLVVSRGPVKVRAGLFRKEEREGLTLSLVPHRCD